METIKNFEELIESQLEPHQKVKEYKTSRLIAAGENYGSVMVAFDITIKNEKDNTEEDLHLVGKLLPPNEMLRKIFNVQVSVKKEIGFYKEIVPALRNFQRKLHTPEISIFPELWTARLNLEEGSDIVTDDSVLLIENLKTKGYTTCNRLKMFDLETTKFILKNLAAFHAVAIALKLQNPEEFDKIRKYFKEAMSKDNMPEQHEEHMKTLRGRYMRALEENEKSIQFSEILGKHLENHDMANKVREPWATISHNDLWVNNIMLKFENNKPVSMKLVDFQIYVNGSAAKDVIFLLFSSTQDDVLIGHFDELVKFYHDTFLNVLKEHQCDTSDFSFESFAKEMELEARQSEITQALFMVQPILAQKEAVKELADLTEDTFIENEFSPAMKAKIQLIVPEFVKRNWLP